MSTEGPAAHRIRGLSAAEALVVVTLIAMAATVTFPSVAELRDAGRMSAATRDLALKFRALRWTSVARNRARGLLFDRDEAGWHWFEIEDGNGNGLRTAEARNGTDPVLSGPHRVEDRVGHVRLGFPSGGPFPRVPPRRGWIGDEVDPIQFGVSNLVSFRPLGTASSGTLYLTDGRDRLHAIVLFGPSARIRVWRYDTRTGRWTS